MEAIEITDMHTLWAALIEHLKRVEMLRHAVSDEKPIDNGYYFYAADDEQVIGHIVIKKQPLTVPASYLNQDQPVQLIDELSNPLYEMFVHTFAVEQAYRRQGYGRALQLAALQKCRETGCYQMRSWSSADKLANYALKINLGFAVHPALYPMPGSNPISGVYFIRQLAQET